MAKSFLNSTNTRMVALADIFNDKLEAAYRDRDAQHKEKGYQGVDKSKCFFGPDAWQKVIELNDVDIVQISSPAYSHPQFLEAAVKAGKHVYCEKPVALDVDGVKKVQEISAQVSDKQSVAIGFQIRKATAYSEMVKRIQNGDIGEVLSVQLYYYAASLGLKWRDDVSVDEARIRNHFWFWDLSGGTYIDQPIHLIDVCNWALKEKLPVLAVGSGDRNGRDDRGDVYSNCNVLYKYPGDIDVTVQSSQVGPVWGDVCTRFVGADGIAEAHYEGGVFVKGKNPWDSGIAKCPDKEISEEDRKSGSFKSALGDSDPNKEKHFVDSIVSGKHINEIEQGCNSTLSALLGRHAMTGQKPISWKEMINSGEDLNHGIDLSKFKSGTL